MGKRLLASFLAAAMMLTMAPFAFAAENSIVEASGEELQAKINNAADGQTIKLTGNTTVDITIPAGKNIVLDLDNHTLTNTNAGKATLTVENGATATVQNGSIVGGTGHYNIAVGTTDARGGTLTLNNVTATAGNTGSSMIDNWGTLTINSGTYTGGLDVVKSEEGSKLTINGGAFTLNYGTYGITGVILNYGDATITGGEFKQASSGTGARVVVTGVVEGYTAITRISGGTFTNTKSTGNILHPLGKATSDNFEVTGGNYNKKLPSYYCPEKVFEYDSATKTYHIGGKAVAVASYYNYATVADAIKNVGKNGTVKLLDDVSEDISVPANKKFKLDLNGHTLTNASGHTITVAAKGTLTIQGEGTVDNVTHGKAAIVNNGTVTLNGGTYTRSKENPENNKDDGGGNSYYTILNDKGGNMTINSGVTVTNTGHFSSMIRNGGEEKSVLTINGGTFSGGINTIKNDELGELTINGGNFSNTSQYVVMNWNNATINGGTFKTNASAEAVLFSAKYDDTRAVGELTITGGTFKGVDKQLMIDTYYSEDYIGSASVSGGVFTADVKNFCAPGYKTELTNGVYVVKAGTNDAINAIDAALEAVKNDEPVSKEDTKKAVTDAVAAVKDIPNDKLTDTTTMDKLAKLEEAYKAANTDNAITVTVENADTVETKVADNGVKNAALSADAGQTVTINVDKNTTDAENVANAIKIATGSEETLNVEALDITMKINGTEAQPKAPVVLTFELPAGKDNAKIYRIENGTATAIPTTVNATAGTISGTFDHFSTYGVSYQAATANMNTYQVTLTPRPADVSAGDTITYDVALKHTGGDNAKIGMFRIVPKAPAGLTDQTISLATVSDGQSLIIGHDNDINEDYIAFNASGEGKELAVGDSMNVGTITYTVGDCGNDGDKVVVTGTATLNNAGKRYQLDIDFAVPQEVTYHEIEVIFQQDSATSKTMYARYNTSYLYDNIAAMISNTKAKAPTLNLNMGDTEYRLRDTNWYEWTAPTGDEYVADSTVFKTSVTYVTNKVNLVEIVLPTDPTVTVNADEDHPLTSRDNRTFVDEGADLKFTVGKNETSGEKYEVVVKAGNAEVPSNKITWTTNEDGTITGEVQGDAITGKVTFDITSVIDLSEDDIYIFTDGNEDDKAFVQYSAYSKDDTLVLIQGKGNTNYALSEDQPLIYKTSGYAGIETGKNYNYAVLIPKTNIVSKAAILEALTKTYGLHVTQTENPNLDDVNQFLEWDTNGNMDNSKYDWSDVQATKDFARTDTLEWENGPSDGLLLLANVKTYDSTTGTYTMERDGHIDSYDIDTFLYSHAGFPRP